MTDPDRPRLREPTADDRDRGIPQLVWLGLAILLMLIFAGAILYVGRG